VKLPERVSGPEWATLVVRNGRVLTMDPRRPVATALAARGARIIAVGSDEDVAALVRPGVTEVHDADGLVVAPGFVDIHAHLDWGGSLGPEVFVRQGVTTVVTGNCGISIADVGSHLDAVDAAGAQCNVASFVGLMRLRRLAGQDDLYAPSSPAQIDRLQGLADEALAAGAVGVSLGPEYVPGAGPDELMALAGPAAAHGRLVASHVRHAVARAPEAVQELVDLGEAVGCAVQVSHVGSIGGSNIDATLAVVERALVDGLDVAADCYPYDAWSTMLQSAVFDGDWRARHQVDFGDVEVVSGDHAGERLDERLFAELRASADDVSVVGHAIPWRAVTTALRRPYCMVGSDGVPELDAQGNVRGHPRMAGTFPRVLGPLVRDERLFDLPEALFKMTAQPAGRLGLAAKGVLAPGCDADMVVFDPVTVADAAGYGLESCAAAPVGLRLVIVRGVLTVRDGVYTGAMAGRAARASAGAALDGPSPEPLAQPVQSRHDGGAA
jgi:N-acyl-D-amino-acid deacylase